MKQVLVLLLFILLVHGTAGTRDNSATLKIDTLMNAYYDNGVFDGVILVSDKGRPIYHKAFGIADREWHIPMTLDTKFRIGSLSKPFTALVILQLVEDGRLRLDGTIADYLPDYQGKAKDRITLHHLLTHTSGILNALKPEEEAIRERLPHNLRDLIKYAEQADLYAEPGKEFHYSNFGYNILACIAEKITDKSFSLLLQEKIFNPAGMANTAQYMDTRIEERLAQGYEYKLLYGFEKATFFDNSYAVGCGGMISTAEDLFKWHRALATGQLLSPALQDKMFEPSQQNSYGYGWGIGKKVRKNEQDTLTVADHSGSINGFGSYMAQVLNDASFVVVLKNHRNDTYISPAYASNIGQEILAILYGETVPVAKKSIAKHIARYIGRDGVDKATNEYYRIKTEDSAGYGMDESELNKLGIELFFKFHRPNDALKIFEINMVEFPKSYNTYDSFAYILMQQKEYVSAIRCYRQGLEVLKKYPDQNSHPGIQKDAQNALKYIAEMEEKLLHL